MEEKSLKISKQLDESKKVLEENSRLKSEMEKMLQVFNNEPDGAGFLEKIKG